MLGHMERGNGALQNYSEKVRLKALDLHIESIRLKPDRGGGESTF